MTLIPAHTTAIGREAFSVANARCKCGSGEVVSISPGEEAVYAIARDAQGTQDVRLGLIMVRRPVDAVALCRGCWGRRYGKKR